MIEFKLPDLEPVELDDSFKVVSKGYGWQLVSNNKVAFEILGAGRKRERLHVQYEEEQDRLAKKPAVVVQEPLRETFYEEPIAVKATKPVDSEVTVFIPAKDEWFEARVVKSLSPKILVLELTTGDSVTCIPPFVTESPGGHILCLPVDTIGAVRMEYFDGRYRALEYRVDSEPSSLDEKAQIFSWNTTRNIGKAVRPCGCHIFIANTLDESIYGTVDNGDWIRYKLERSKSREGCWVGVSAQKIEEKENGL
jgi:hypothetical protein